MMGGGMLGSERVVPEAWVHDSITPGAEFLKPGALGETGRPGNGYQWWFLKNLNRYWRKEA
jgi:hypothetical protein